MDGTRKQTQHRQSTVMFIAPKALYMDEKLPNKQKPKALKQQEREETVNSPSLVLYDKENFVPLLKHVAFSDYGFSPFLFYLGPRTCVYLVAFLMYITAFCGIYLAVGSQHYVHVYFLVSFIEPYFFFFCHDNCSP